MEASNSSPFKLTRTPRQPCADVGNIGPVIAKTLGWFTGDELWWWPDDDKIPKVDDIEHSVLEMIDTSVCVEYDGTCARGGQ